MAKLQQVPPPPRPISMISDLAVTGCRWLQAVHGGVLTLLYREKTRQRWNREYHQRRRGCAGVGTDSPDGGKLFVLIHASALVFFSMASIVASASCGMEDDSST